MSKKILALAAILVVLAAPLAAANKVLFYEIGLNSKYKKDDGYSKLRDQLTAKGYSLASITKGELSKTTLETYDILLINPSKTLTTEEISAILWFVNLKGGGLFIVAGSPKNANQITIPFGITVDDSDLIDATNSIEEGKPKEFTVTRIKTDETNAYIKTGVNTLGFYTGPGITVARPARQVVTGDPDTYSESLSFSTGSEPPVAASALFGQGLVFAISDADFMSNDHIEEYDNMKFAENVIDWLSISHPAPEGNFSLAEIEIMLGQLKLEKLRVEAERDRLLMERETLEAQNNYLDEELTKAADELFQIKKGKLGPFTRMQWALLLFGVMIIVAVGVSSKKKTALTTTSMKESEDILGELGYEFEDEPKSRENGKPSKPPEAKPPEQKKPPTPPAGGEQKPTPKNDGPVTADDIDLEELDKELENL